MFNFCLCLISSCHWNDKSSKQVCLCTYHCYTYNKLNLLPLLSSSSTLQLWEFVIGWFSARLIFSNILVYNTYTYIYTQYLLQSSAQFGDFIPSDSQYLSLYYINSIIISVSNNVSIPIVQEHDRENCR